MGRPGEAGASYANRLATRTAENSDRTVRDLLSALSAGYGVASFDIASLLGVSVPALRGWRKNAGETAPDNQRRLAQLVGFFDLAAEVVPSPARWMSMPLVGGSNITAGDLYTSGHVTELLDLAAGNADSAPEAVLDTVEPGWRVRWESKYEVFEAEDGELSMRPLSY